ncbi:MAG: ATP-binding cassette domain-containing protein [Lachnospiraceae bacterium]|nr:ATP-binding cassette domain-containing protein [Lachnospiraceae bacterium]
MAENTPIVDFEFTFTYEGETRPALHAAGGSIERGKCVVLCGGSGCGKSTLLRCINHLIPQFYEGELKGYCRINGEDTEGMTAGAAGRIAASVFQDPRSHFFTVNSSSEVAFGLENHGLPQAEIRRRVDEAFRSFGLERLKDRDVYELSSGERQLVAVISAWAMDTELFLLDEPTANLDFAAIGGLRELLLKLKAQGKTLVLSEHRLHYLGGVADEYWIMAGGRIQQRLTAGEMESLSEEERIRYMLRASDLKKIRLPDRRWRETEEKQKMEVENLCCSYRKGGAVLSDISLQAYTGEVIGIIGPNGSGKTTFGKTLAGLLKAAAGQISYQGKPLKAKERQREILFIMQEAEFQFFTNSVENELRYGRKPTRELEDGIEGLLKQFGLWQYRHRHPFSLSGGQMQKLSLMLAYLSEKRVVILDEPTAGLDAESLRECARLIGRMRERKIVFVITHDVELIAQVCTRCICFSNGRLEQEIRMKEDADLNILTRYMEQNFRLSDTARMQKRMSSRRHLDPRTKLLILLAAMMAVSVADMRFVFPVAFVVTALAFFEGFWHSALAGAGFMLLLSGFDALYPGTVLSFFANFFPRLMVTWLGLETIIGQDEATKTLAALRRLHIPEFLITVCSVVFRFFPVLSHDIRLMGQSIKTRGVFYSVLEKLRALPEYMEILLVPMALRVIRIAEALSASAETRGISLKGRRSSYPVLRFWAADAVFIVLLAGALLAGFVL